MCTTRHRRLRSGFARLSLAVHQSDRAGGGYRVLIGTRRQRNALSVLPQRDRSDRQQHRARASRCWQSFNGGGANVGQTVRYAEQLRTAELHFDAAGHALLAFWRSPARPDRRQRFAAEFQRHLYLRRRSAGAGAGCAEPAGAGCPGAAGDGADHIDRTLSAHACSFSNWAIRRRRFARWAAARRNSASTPALPDLAVHQVDAGSSPATNGGCGRTSL